MIWVVVDRLTKVRHFAPCSTAIDAEGLAELFLSNIFYLHGLPDAIVSDWGPQFASCFWKHLCNCLKIEPHLSTAFHPETDGQTEWTNAIMEQYLPAYVNYQQDDWVWFLPMVELTANNNVLETTGILPFFANYGLNPKIDFKPDIWVDNPEEDQAHTLADRLSEMHDLIKSEMVFAQDQQQEYANRYQLPAPAYRPGDTVWLNARNICTNQPSRKLDNKHYGPFPIVNEVGKYAYQLELPPTMDIDPIFHISLLEPGHNDPLLGQVTPAPGPVIVEGEPEYEVEEVLDSRTFRHQLQYLIK
jgi:hypothetical protein